MRITATRELIRHKKKRARDVPIEQRARRRLLDERRDPALEAAQGRVPQRVRDRAARSDRRRSSAEDRTLLRQQIVDELSIDEIGAAFGVHRATAARWLTRARGALVAATHKRLAERLKLPVEQIESVIRLVQSKLDASVIRYLEDDRASGTSSSRSRDTSRRTCSRCSGSAPRASARSTVAS